MSISSILPRHIFGCRGDLRDGLHQGDDNNLLYAAGHTVVLHNIERGSQLFIAGSQDSEAICALAVAPSKKHLAVAQRAEKGTVTVYDRQTLKRRKVLVPSEAVSRDVASMAFSVDGRLLAVQGGGPDWLLVVWAWERAKAIGSMRTADSSSRPVYQVKFSPGSPTDVNLVTVAGQGVFRALRAEDMGFKVVQHSLTKKENTNFTSHAWVDGDRMAVGTEAGELFIADSSDLKATLSLPVQGEAVDCVAPHSKGFVVGTAKGSFCHFERDEEGAYKCLRVHAVDGGQALRSVVSMAEDTLYALSATGQLLKVTTAAGKTKGGETRVQSLLSGYHQGDVTGLSGCLRKPIVASTAADRTLRLWNFNERSSELVKASPEEAFAVSLHPSGLAAVVGYADKLRLLTILLDDVRTVKELPIRSCRTVVFSHGGHCFAAANGMVIAVFNTYSCEQLGVLRGHSGKVRCLAWGADDSCLTSAGAEGAVYEWSLKDMRRVRENVLKGCNYACLAVGASGGPIYAAGSDNRLKALEDAGSVGLRIAADLEAGCTITQLALPSGGRLLFAATSRGTIRAYKLPLGEPAAFQELHCSAGPVAQLALSPDHSQLFAGGSEGTVFVFEVKDRDPSRGAAADRREEQLAWAEEVLVTKAALEEKHQRIADLESQVVEVELAKEYALRVKDKATAEQVNAAAAAHAAELKAQRQMLLDLRQESEGLLSDRDRQLQQSQEKHQAQLAAMEAHSQEKVAAAAKAAQETAAEAAATVAEAERRAAEAAAAHDRVLQEVGEELMARIKEEQDNQEALQLAKEAQEKEFEILRALMEEATDQEIEELRAKYESKLAAEREVSVRLQGENGLMRNKFASIMAELNQLKAEVATLNNAKQDLLQSMKQLERDVAGLWATVRERDTTITERDTRIAGLKAEAQQLAKFKFVLEYKLDEVRSQLEPREQTVLALQAQLKEMEGELQQYHSRTKALELAVSDLRMQQSALRKDAARHLQGLKAAQAAIRLFQRDLQEAISLIQDPAALKAAVKTIFQKHAANAEPATSISEDILQEFQRQREYMEGTIAALKVQLKKASKQAHTQQTRDLQERNILIAEIENLRHKPAKAKSKSSSPSKPQQSAANAEAAKALQEHVAILQAATTDE